MPNYSPRISAGLDIEEVDFKFTVGASGAVGTTYQGKAGRVTVSRTTDGEYLITLSKPYPVRLLNCFAAVSDADGNDVVTNAVYKTGSYSASAGTFTIYTRDPWDGSPAATDPANGAEVHVSAKFLRTAALDG